MPGFRLLTRTIVDPSSQMEVLIEGLQDLQEITKRKLKKTQEEANIAKMEIQEKKGPREKS